MRGRWDLRLDVVLSWRPEETEFRKRRNGCVWVLEEGEERKQKREETWVWIQTILHFRWYFRWLRDWFLVAKFNQHTQSGNSGKYRNEYSSTFYPEGLIIDIFLCHLLLSFFCCFLFVVLFLFILFSSSVLLQALYDLPMFCGYSCLYALVWLSWALPCH